MLHLPPVTGNPNPAAWPVHPMPGDPHGYRAGTHHPTARDPNIVGPSPPPIPRSPDIPRSWGYGLRFNSHRRRSPGDDYLTGWTCCRDFLCGCCRCHGGRFFRAPRQEQYREDCQIRSCSHRMPLKRIRFATRLWLCPGLMDSAPRLIAKREFWFMLWYALCRRHTYRQFG